MPKQAGAQASFQLPAASPPTRLPAASTPFAPAHGSHQGASMQDYRNLKVWQKAHQMTLRTYAFSATLTTPPAWTLRDQMIRAAISIPSNIAEGTGRGTDSDFARFVTYSLGSSNELEYLLLLARDWKLEADWQHRLQSVRIAGCCSSSLPSSLSRPPRLTSGTFSK